MDQVRDVKRLNRNRDRISSILSKCIRGYRESIFVVIEKKTMMM